MILVVCFVTFLNANISFGVSVWNQITLLCRIMNKTIAPSSYSSESWLIASGSSRRASTESVYSIQGKETDYVEDTPDTESYTSDDDTDEGLEYEPATDSDEDPPPPLFDDSSDQTDNKIIRTRVIEVCVADERDLELADAEETSEAEPDVRTVVVDGVGGCCVQCGEPTRYLRYPLCHDCYRSRKDFFPPRPKWKHKRKRPAASTPRALSQDSGVVTAGSSHDLVSGSSQQSTDVNQMETESRADRNRVKRRASSADHPNNKRIRVDYSESELEDDSPTTVAPLSKTISAPSRLDSGDGEGGGGCGGGSAVVDGELCIVCVSRPKSGVFVHGRIAHICCCYSCARKVWAQAKRCPVCNCRVTNVLEAIVM